MKKILRGAGQSSMPLPVQTPVLNCFRDVFGLDLLTARQITDCSADLKHLDKDLLYTTYEYPEFVPAITIRWGELATL